MRQLSPDSLSPYSNSRRISYKDQNYKDGISELKKFSQNLDQIAQNFVKAPQKVIKNRQRHFNTLSLQSPRNDLVLTKLPSLLTINQENSQAIFKFQKFTGKNDMQQSKDVSQIQQKKVVKTFSDKLNVIYLRNNTFQLRLKIYQDKLMRIKKPSLINKDESSIRTQNFTLINPTFNHTSQQMISYSQLPSNNIKNCQKIRMLNRTVENQSSYSQNLLNSNKLQ